MMATVLVNRIGQNEIKEEAGKIKRQRPPTLDLLVLYQAFPSLSLPSEGFRADIRGRCQEQI